MYPLLWLSLAFLAGLLLNSACRLPVFLWAGLALICLALLLVERRAKAAFTGFKVRLSFCPLPLALVAAFLFLGAARGALHTHVTSPTDVETYTGSAVRLVGWVSAPPDPSMPSPALRVTVESLWLIDATGTESLVQPVRGSITVRLSGGLAARYGDRLELRGELQPPPILTGFSYREYLARQGVYSQLAGVTTAQPLEGKRGNGLLRRLYQAREHAWAAAMRIFPQPEAALLSGIVLGLDRGIPTGLQKSFQVTGTAHIIAISGFNITILAGLFFTLFGRIFSRWWALVAAILSTSLYTLFVGAEPPVTRAALMGALALFGREIGRASSGINTLGLTAALMSLFNPSLPFDPSFQLSFFATLGMVRYAGPFQDAFRRLAARRLSPETVARLSGPVSEYLLTTLAAQVTTLPILAVHFGRLSLISLLANPLVLPPQPAVMVLSGLAILAGSAWLPLGQLLAWVAWPFAAYTARMVDLLAAVPAASLDLGTVGWWAAGAYFAALFALPVLRRRWSAIRAQIRPALLPAALGMAAVLAWVYAAGLPDGRLHLWIYQPKGEMGMVIVTPGGNRVLVGAPDPHGFAPMLDAHLPLFHRRLDAWLLTSSARRLPDLAALAGRLPVRQAAAPPGLWATAPGAVLEEELIHFDVYPTQLAHRQVWDLGAGERLRVLAVDDTRAALLLEWGNFRALLPGGLSPVDVDANLLSAQPALLVLPGADPAWLDLHPRLAVVTAQAPPGPNCLVLEEGRWLHISTDGKQLWVEQASR